MSAWHKVQTKTKISTGRQKQRYPFLTIYVSKDNLLLHVCLISAFLSICNGMLWDNQMGGFRISKLVRKRLFIRSVDRDFFVVPCGTFLYDNKKACSRWWRELCPCVALSECFMLWINPSANPLVAGCKTPDLFAWLLLAKGFSTFAKDCIHVTFSLGAKHSQRSDPRIAPAVLHVQCLCICHPHQSCLQWVSYPFIHLWPHSFNCMVLNKWKWQNFSRKTTVMPP